MKKYIMTILIVFIFTNSGYTKDKEVIQSTNSENTKTFSRTMLTKSKNGMAKKNKFEAADNEKEISVIECSEMFYKIIKKTEESGLTVEQFHSTC